MEEWEAGIQRGREGRGAAAFEQNELGHNAGTGQRGKQQGGTERMEKVDKKTLSPLWDVPLSKAMYMW